MANTLSTRTWVMFSRHLSNIGEQASLKVTVAGASVSCRDSCKSLFLPLNLGWDPSSVSREGVKVTGFQMEH